MPHRGKKLLQTQLGFIISLVCTFSEKKRTALATVCVLGASLHLHQSQQFSTIDHGGTGNSQHSSLWELHRLCNAEHGAAPPRWLHKYSSSMADCCAGCHWPPDWLCGDLAPPLMQSQEKQEADDVCCGAEGHFVLKCCADCHLLWTIDGKALKP